MNPAVISRGVSRRNAKGIAPTMSEAPEDLDDDPVSARGLRDEGPRHLGCRGAQVDLVEDLLLDARTRGRGDEDDRLAHVFMASREPGRAERLVDGKEAAMLLRTRAHPQPPVAGPGEEPLHGHHVVPCYGRREGDGGAGHDPAEDRERLRERQVRREAEERVVRERDDTVALLPEEGELRVRGLPADHALRGEGQGREGKGEVPQDPRSPPRPPSTMTRSRSRSAADRSFSSWVSIFWTARSSMEANAWSTSGRTRIRFGMPAIEGGGASFTATDNVPVGTGAIRRRVLQPAPPHPMTATRAP